jgi:Ca-activated chloride channel family protein
LKPSRLEIAKDTLVNFISKIISDRVWLIIFAGKPFTSIPLTFDYNFLKDYIKNIDINTINQNYTYLQGTAMWDALLMWIKSLDNSDNSRQKVIILLTDWEANKWIAPLQAVKLARDKNIKVYTIWIWWEKDSFVNLVDNLWRKTKVEIWWVDEKTLQSIASITNASYFRATDSGSLKKIFEELWKLNKTDIEIKKQVTYSPNYEIFEYILIVLIMLFMWFNFFYFNRN